jgi:hypothetical protein
MKKDENKRAEVGASEVDLQKALNFLEGAAQSTDDEKQALLSKAMDGSITPEENDRLAALLAGRNNAPTMRDQVTKSMRPESDERLQKSLDVSEYLDGLHSGMVEALGMVADHIEKSDGRQHNFNVVLAKGVRAIGEMVKSVESRLANIENQPAGAPKAIQSPAQIPHLKKSFSGNASAEGRLSKSEILDTLEAMNIESLEKGRNGMARCGEDLSKAIAKYETQMRVTKPLYDEMVAFRQRANS